MRHLHYTPIPHWFIDETLHKLPASAIKLYLILARRLLKIRRKQVVAVNRLLIPPTYFERRMQCSRATLSFARQRLAHTALIEVSDETGRPLTSRKERSRKNGMYYSIRPNPVSSISENQNISPPSALPSFSWQKFLDGLHNSPRRTLNIIAYYWEKSGSGWKSKTEAEAALSALLPIAEKMTRLGDQQITGAIRSRLHFSPHSSLKDIYQQLTP